MRKIDNSGLLTYIQRYSEEPALFEPGESLFWDDPHISKGMLEAHLNPEHDAASRRPEKIEKEVNHLVSSGIIKPGDRVLDLGCGPGLYASRLADKGIKVTAIDISQRSLDYAIKQAGEKGLEIDYRRMDFFDIDFRAEFDVVIQTYGELGVFPGEKRDELLTKIYRALKNDGLLIFDVTSKDKRTEARANNNWYVSDGGFWRPGLHLVLEQSFDYQEADARVDQYIVVDDNGVSVYRTWIHDYTPLSIGEALRKAGFEVLHLWNDLIGSLYTEGGNWIAIIAKKCHIMGT